MHNNLGELSSIIFTTTRVIIIDYDDRSKCYFDGLSLYIPKELYNLEVYAICSMGIDALGIIVKEKSNA